MVCWAALVVKHDFAACAVIYAKSFCSTQAAMSEPVGDTIDNVVGRHKQNTSFVVLIAAEQIIVFVFDARVSIFALQVDKVGVHGSAEQESGKTLEIVLKFCQSSKMYLMNITVCDRADIWWKVCCT